MRCKNAGATKERAPEKPGSKENDCQEYYGNVVEQCERGAAQEAMLDFPSPARMDAKYRHIIPVRSTRPCEVGMSFWSFSHVLNSSGGEQWQLSSGQQQTLYEECARAAVPTKASSQHSINDDNIAIPRYDDDDSINNNHTNTSSITDKSNSSNGGDKMREATGTQEHRNTGNMNLRMGTTGIAIALPHLM